MRVALGVLLVTVLSAVTGCAARHCPGSGYHHARHRAHECHRCVDWTSMAVAGSALLVDAAVHAAASTPPSSDGTHPDRRSDTPERTPPHSEVHQGKQASACLYNPQCLPPEHRVCRDAPDGCCPCR